MDLTLSVDERTLEAARRMAEGMGKSLDQVVQEYLETLVRRDSAERDMEELVALSEPPGESQGPEALDEKRLELRRAVAELLESSRKASSGSGGRRWTREELYERDSMEDPSSKARDAWLEIPEVHRTRILNNVWCRSCRNVTTIVRWSEHLERGQLVLKGECIRCGGRVARAIER